MKFSSKDTLCLTLERDLKKEIFGLNSLNIKWPRGRFCFLQNEVNKWEKAKKFRRS